MTKVIRRNATKQIAAVLALAAMVRKLRSDEDGVGERPASVEEIRAEMKAGKIKRIEQDSAGEVQFIVNSALWYVVSKAAPQPAAETAEPQKETIVQFLERSLNAAGQFVDEAGNLRGGDWFNAELDKFTEDEQRDGIRWLRRPGTSAARQRWQLGAFSYELRKDTPLEDAEEQPQPPAALPAHAWLDRAELVKVLRMAKHAVGKAGRTRSVKLTLSLEQSCLTATDLDTAVRLPIYGLQVQQPGQFSLDHKAALDLLGKLKDRDVTLEADATGGAVVRTATLEANLPAGSTGGAIESEALVDFDGQPHHQIRADGLRSLITKTIHAVATESLRYATAGVMWELQGERARLVATDGRRLAFAECAAEQHGKAGAVAQMPVVGTKAMKLLAEVLKGCDDDEKVSVRFGPHFGQIKVKGVEIGVRLVEGRFPPYREVLPKKPPLVASLNVGGLLDLCEQAAKVTDDEHRGVDFVFSEDKLALKFEDGKKYQGTMAARWNAATPLAVLFDPKLLVPYLKTLDKKADVAFCMVDGSTAAVLKSGDCYQFVIMPLFRGR